MILSINHRDGWGGPSWNHPDHRAVGRALLDAVRDAANPWLFPECGPAWSGVRFAAFNASPVATHAADVTGYLDRGIESLRCHELYLANLDGGSTITAGRRFSADRGVTPSEQRPAGAQRGVSPRGRLADKFCVSHGF